MKIQSIEKRIASNRAWTRGEIRYGTGRLEGWDSIFVLIGLWNIGIVLIQNFKNPETPAGRQTVIGIMALLILPIIALKTFEIFQFLFSPKAICRITNKAGVIGQSISGRIVTPGIIPIGEYRIHLQCIQKSSKDTPQAQLQSYWSDHQFIQHTQKNAALDASFWIEIPKSLPETGDRFQNGEVYWQLGIIGPDYEDNKAPELFASFIVPVFRLAE